MNNTATNDSKPLDTLPKILESVMEKAQLGKCYLVSMLKDTTGLSDSGVRSWFIKDILPRELVHEVSTKDRILECFTGIEMKYHASLSDEKEALELLYTDRPVNIPPQKNSSDTFCTPLPKMLLGKEASYYYEKHFPTETQFGMIASITNHHNDITEGLDAFFASHPDHLEQAKARRYFELCFTEGTGAPLPGCDFSFWSRCIPMLPHFPKNPQDIPPRVAAAITEEYINHGGAPHLRMSCQDIYRFLKLTGDTQRLFRSSIYGFFSFTKERYDIIRLLGNGTISNKYPEKMPDFDKPYDTGSNVFDTFDFDWLLADELICHRSHEYGAHYSKLLFDKLNQLVAFRCSAELVASEDISLDFYVRLKTAREKTESFMRKNKLKGPVEIVYLYADFTLAAREFIEWSEQYLGKFIQFPSPVGFPFVPVLGDDSPEFISHMKEKSQQKGKDQRSTIAIF